MSDEPGSGANIRRNGSAADSVSPHPPSRRVRCLGIGEYVVSNSEGDVLTTFALGSCVAVCLWDPSAHVGGMLHFMLPDSSLNAERSRLQPATFADTGIALLFHAAYELGARKKRCVVRLVGGAEISPRTQVEGPFNVGLRNILAARGVLWRNGILIAGEEVGGSVVRSVSLALTDGRVAIKTDGNLVTEL